MDSHGTDRIDELPVADISEDVAGPLLLGESARCEVPRFSLRRESCTMSSGRGAGEGIGRRRRQRQRLLLRMRPRGRHSRLRRRRRVRRLRQRVSRRCVRRGGRRGLPPRSVWRLRAGPRLRRWLRLRLAVRSAVQGEWLRRVVELRGMPTPRFAIVGVECMPRTRCRERFQIHMCRILIFSRRRCLRSAPMSVLRCNVTSLVRFPMQWRRLRSLLLSASQKLQFRNGGWSSRPLHRL